MSRMKKAAAIGGGIALVGLVCAGGAWMWVNRSMNAVFSATWETHTVDFPVPFPLSEQELADLRAERTAVTAPAEGGAAPVEGEPVTDPLAGLDLDAIALERAQARGKHFTSSIYACAACHGGDFGGGSMIDEPVIGILHAPNITSGGKTRDFTVADWDRAVRHGVLTGGRTSMMPVGDFRNLTDHELSDIIAYIRSLPPKEGGETRLDWGPMGKVLVATGKLVPDVYKVADHQQAHAVEPPPVGPTVEYGEHIVSVCTGCHRETLNGGPMPFGPPDWPAAANLTPSPDGIGAYTFEDFEKVLRRGIRKNGENVRMPMAEMIPNGMAMTDTEVHALYAYLHQLPAMPTGE